MDEVRSAFTSESDINFVEANKLKYMLACLDEAMRMYPPVPGTFPRDVPIGGDQIGDTFIPENAIVGVTQFATYHSADNFYLPDEFIPERWLDDERFVNDNKAAFQPFSVGPRNCVGRNLAYFEMRLVLARVLYNFDLVKLDPTSVRNITFTGLRKLANQTHVNRIIGSTRTFTCSGRSLSFWCS